MKLKAKQSVFLPFLMKFKHTYLAHDNIANVVTKSFKTSLLILGKARPILQDCEPN